MLSVLIAARYQCYCLMCHQPQVSVVGSSWSPPQASQESWVWGYFWKNSFTMVTLQKRKIKLLKRTEVIHNGPSWHHQSTPVGAANQESKTQRYSLLMWFPSSHGPPEPPPHLLNHYFWTLFSQSWVWFSSTHIRSRVQWRKYVQCKASFKWKFQVHSECKRNICYWASPRAEGCLALFSFHTVCTLTECRELPLNVVWKVHWGSGLLRNLPPHDFTQNFLS